MRVHACLLGIGLGLWLGFPGTAPAEPSGADPAAAAAPDPGRQLPWLRRFAHSLPRFHWGLGETDQIDPELVVVDPSAPFKSGSLIGLLPGGEALDDALDLKGFLRTLKKFGASMRSSWGDLSEPARQEVLFGRGDAPRRQPRVR